MFHYLLFFALSLSSWSLAASDKCPIVERYPHTSTFTLSSGVIVSLPCKSNRFDVIALMGLMNYDHTMQIMQLQQARGFPLKFGKKALGMFMIYQYHQSDLGPFNEIYFLAPITRKKTRGALSALWQLKKLNRRHSKPATQDIHFFYFKVFSGTMNAQLASKEIWGIDSTLADIQIQHLHEKSGESFSLKVAGEEWLNFHAPKTTYLVPQSGNLNLLTAGGSPDGEQPIYSRVISCGRFHMGKFSAKKHWRLTSKNPLTELFEQLEFKPFSLAKGLDMQAVQFAPIPSATAPALGEPTQ